MLDQFRSVLKGLSSIDRDRVTLAVLAIMATVLLVSTWFSSGLDAMGTFVLMIMALAVFALVVNRGNT